MQLCLSLCAVVCKVRGSHWQQHAPTPSLSPCPAPKRLQFPFLSQSLCSTMAAPISVCDFVQQVQEDLSSPTTSTFTSHMARCKATAGSMEEVSGAWGGDWHPRGGHLPGSPVGSALIRVSLWWFLLCGAGVWCRVPKAKVWVC